MVRTAEKRLRAAIEAGDFAAVTVLAAEFTKESALAFQSACNNEERQAIASETIAAFQAVLNLARVTRSHVAAHLRSLTRDTLFYRARREAHHTWHLEG